MKKFIPLILLTKLLCVSNSIAEESEEVDPVLKFQAQRIDSLKEQIIIFQSQINEHGTSVENVSAIKEKLLSQLNQMTELRQKRNKMEKEIDQQYDEFDAYRELAKNDARVKARGEVLGTLTLPSGRTYHDVKIREVNDVGLIVTHRSGRARLPFLQLSGEFRERFHYDAAIAQEVIIAERLKTVQYQKRIAANHSSQRMAAAEKRLAAGKERALRPVASPYIPNYGAYVNESKIDTGPVSTWRERRDARRARRYSRSTYYYNNNATNYYCPPTPRVIRPNAIPR